MCKMSNKLHIKSHLNYVKFGKSVILMAMISVEGEGGGRGYELNVDKDKRDFK